MGTESSEVVQALIILCVLADPFPMLSSYEATTTKQKQFSGIIS